MHKHESRYDHEIEITILMIVTCHDHSSRYGKRKRKEEGKFYSLSKFFIFVVDDCTPHTSHYSVAKLIAHDSSRGAGAAPAGCHHYQSTQSSHQSPRHQSILSRVCL
ncbi:hypothetical protein M8J75_008960 [Diaphorina citri]|nr:hypothetical protein M8J75_008960 [Diaphorina citri]